MASGTLFANRAELLQAHGCSCKLLKEVVVPEEAARCLLVSIQGNQHRVLLEATADIAWQAGHFIGRGGPGSFSAVEADVNTFDMNSLGKFLPSWEVIGEAGIECKGVLRPAFALALAGNQLEPVGRASPQLANPLCPFLKKSMKLKKGTIIAL